MPVNFTLVLFYILFFLFSSSFCKLIYFMPLFSYHQTHACVRKRFLRQCQLSYRDQTKRIDYWGPLILSMNLFTCLCKYYVACVYADSFAESGWN